MNSLFVSGSIPCYPNFEKVASELDYYYCLNCLKIPKIVYEGEYVVIECTCGTKEETKIQNVDEDITNPDILKEICKYKKYKLLLKSYNEIISIFSKNLIMCEFKKSHPTEERTANQICVECKNKPYIC